MPYIFNFTITDRAKARPRTYMAAPRVYIDKDIDKDIDIDTQYIYIHKHRTQQ
jgi:hypothetical protein